MALLIEAMGGYLQVFTDGTLNRPIPGIVEASPDEYIRGYKSRDIVIDSSIPITARIYFPEILESESRPIPAVAYFHGGGFCIASTTWLGYHDFVGGLSVYAKCIVFSVDYRLAPEYRLPAAYDDCYTALKWLWKNAGADPWLEKVDLSRVFLSGDGAGGNIAHQVMTRVVQDNVDGFTIKGLIPIHPLFGSKNRTDLEMSEGSIMDVRSNDICWTLSLPMEQNRDYVGCNVEKTELSESEWTHFPEVLVFVAGLDFLKERGVMYAEFLQKKGVERVKLINDEKETRAFNIFRPYSQATRLLQKKVGDFIDSVI